MIRLTYSNRTEALLETLVARIDARRRAGDPLAPTWIVVPNRNVERYVELGIARHLGIAANLRFLRLAELVRRWLEGSGPLLIETALSARVLRALLDDELVARPSMAPVRRYLDGAGEAADAVDLRRVELALHVARLFEEYGFSRPELLAAWDAGKRRFAGSPYAATEAWQSELWRAIRVSSPGLRTLAESVERAHELPPPSEELHVFGLSYVAQIFARIYAALGARAELYLYTLNPCEEFWEDVETAGELRRRRRVSDAEPEWLWQQDDPFKLSVDTETPLLRLWGRPGREHVRLLGALTECDFTPAFVDPLDGLADSRAGALPLFAPLSAPPLLARLQHDVLARSPRGPAPHDAIRDPSVQFLACPSIRREVETVAAEIWNLVETLEGLSFDEIAVLVNGPDRDLYLPHITAVFEEAHGIPFHVADVSLASASPIVVAALRLFALPATRFTRPDVLAVITHPCVRPHDVDAHAWARLADRLAIFHGLDRAAYAGTYVDEDLFNWEQGLVRIALGAFMASEASGEPSFVTIDGSRYLPEEAPPGDETAASFAALVRSLSSDVRFARTARLSLTEWSRFFGAMARAYLVPDGEREESALRRVLRALTILEDHDLDGTPVSYTIAHELAKEAVGALGSGRELAGGVAVSSLVPMRAIPFRAIFVLGLGEGRFPAADRRDSMDLRAARRHAGDVTPPERDRYTLLETLLCARERIYFSYVARDEQTGDELAPSAVIEELLDVIEASYLPGARKSLVRWPALRRHEDEAMTRVLPEAAAERRARLLGEKLDAQLAREGHARLGAELVRPDVLRRAARIEAVRDALALAPLPEKKSEAGSPETTLRLSLSALRRFLECPLQGWTRAMLRLDEHEIDESFALADEPFAPSALETTMALRASFTTHVVRNASLQEAYASEVARRKARGRWPVGALETLIARDHRLILERWRAALDASRGPDTRYRTIRFGSAASDDASEEVLDPIVIAFDDDPRAPGSGRPLRVELVGRTDLIAEPPRSSVLPLVRGMSGTRGRVTSLRHALRAFFDHAALSASGRVAPSHRAVHLLGDRDDARPAIVAFDALSQQSASRWLGELVRDLVSRKHVYLMPCEAVLRLAERWNEVRGEDLVASIEEVRDHWDGGQSRFGPVREPLRYPPPAPGEAEEAAERRFGPFLRSILKEDA